MPLPDPALSDLRCHPEPGRGQFLPRLGYRQQGLLGILSERGITTTVAPLHFLRDNPELSLVPEGRPSGVVLDPCCQLRLLPWADRPSAFRSLGYGNDPEPYDPEAARLTNKQILRLAVDPIAEARGRGGTLLLTAAHPAGGPGTRGRDLELLLAELGLRHFLAEGMREPPPFAALGIRREIYVSIAIHARDLANPGDRQGLHMPIWRSSPMASGCRSRAFTRGPRANRSAIRRLSWQPCGRAEIGRLVGRRTASSRPARRGLLGEHRLGRERAIPGSGALAKDEHERRSAGADEDGLSPQAPPLFSGWLRGRPYGVRRGRV
jgi:hypothetical protein